MNSIVEMQTKMAALFGPSGHEKQVATFIQEYAKPFSSEISTDAMGNLIIRKKGNGKRIMLTAHMDSLGVLITRVEGTGYLRFCSIGATRFINNYFGALMVFNNGTKGFVFGETSSDSSKVNSSLYMDIGASSEDEAKSLVKVGDAAVFQANTYVQNGKIFSTYLDNRIGCVALMVALSRLEECKNDVYLVFSTQEEVGFRGIKSAAQRINPDYSITVDVTSSTDIPCESNGNSELGKGAAIKLADCSALCNRDFIDRIEGIASANNIAHQLDIMYNGTETGAIQQIGLGTVVGGISIPTRYIHNAIEVANISDIEASIDLIVKTVCQISDSIA